jgi:hypothetical protein
MPELGPGRALLSGRSPQFALHRYRDASRDSSLIDRRILDTLHDLEILHGNKAVSFITT